MAFLLFTSKVNKERKVNTGALAKGCFSFVLMQTRREREQAEEEKSKALSQEMYEAQPYLYSFQVRAAFYLNEPQADRFRKDITVDILATPFGIAEQFPEAVANWPVSAEFEDDFEPVKVGEMRFCELDFLAAREAGVEDDFDIVAEHPLSYMLMQYFLERDPAESDPLPVLSAPLREVEFQATLDGCGPECFLEEAWLEPTHRGRGVGRQALSYCYQRFFSHCAGLSTLIYPLQADGERAIKRLELQGLEQDVAKATQRLARHLEAIGFTLQPRAQGTFMRVTDWAKWEDFYKFVCEEWEA